MRAVIRLLMGMGGGAGILASGYGIISKISEIKPYQMNISGLDSSILARTRRAARQVGHIIGRAEAFISENKLDITRMGAESISNVLRGEFGEHLEYHPGDSRSLNGIIEDEITMICNDRGGYRRDLFSKYCIPE